MVIHNSMPLSIIITAIVLHFLFDWILQPRNIAKRKGMTEDGILATFGHIGINIIPFSMILGAFLVLKGYDFSVVLSGLCFNLIIHFFVDIVLPKGKTERKMVTLTAIDQIIHLVILFFTLNKIIN